MSPPVGALGFQVVRLFSPTINMQSTNRNKATATPPPMTPPTTAPTAPGPPPTLPPPSAFFSVVATSSISAVVETYN